MYNVLMCQCFFNMEVVSQARVHTNPHFHGELESVGYKHYLGDSGTVVLPRTASLLVSEFI